MDIPEKKHVLTETNTGDSKEINLLLINIAKIRANLLKTIIQPDLFNTIIKYYGREFNPQLPMLADVKANLSRTIIQSDLINTILKYYEPSIKMEFYSADKTRTFKGYFTIEDFNPVFRGLFGKSFNFKNVKNMEVCGIFRIKKSGQSIFFL